MKRLWRTIVEFLFGKKYDNKKMKNSQTIQNAHREPLVSETVDRLRLERERLLKKNSDAQPPTLKNYDVWKEKHSQRIVSENEVKRSTEKVFSRSKNSKINRVEFGERQEKFKGFEDVSPNQNSLTEKETYVLNYLRERPLLFISPTEVGYNFGVDVKNKQHYNSGHARACLIKLVKRGLLVSNKDGQYKYYKR
jgi:hypothetical protein